MSQELEVIEEKPVLEIKSVKEELKPWKEYEKISFRIAFIFFFLLIVPLNIDYYKRWFTTDWANLHIRDIGGLTGGGFAPFKVQDKHVGAGDRGSLQEYGKGFFTIYAEDGNLGYVSYINWAAALFIALVGTLVWTLIDRKPRNYRVLYYFLIVGVSYSMVIRLEGLTFSKVFPTQMPALALTQLNTPFGDFVAQKLYWIQLSFVHKYETFIGLAELLIMLLLFFRPTRALGAALALFMIGNISIANHVYDGGIHLAASFYAIGGIFVLWNYLPGLWNLFVKEQNVTPQIYHYPFEKKWEKYFRIGSKTFLFGFFFVLSGCLHLDNYKHDSYKVPARPGLSNSKGFYNVTEFKVNNKVIPYSPVDSIRWQEVTFEKWSTLSYTVFRKFDIHGEAGRGKQFKDVDRTYESAGTGGGRRHYYYEADTVKQTIHLYNKNKVYKDEEIILSYQRPTTDRIILSGLNEFKDSIYVVLDRQDKKYPLYEGREKELSLIP